MSLTIAGIEFQVKNTTPSLVAGETVEPFASGGLDLVYQYIPPGEEEAVFHLVENVYSISDTNDPINSAYVPISATFPVEGRIPAGAKDFAFKLIFKGKLGNEEGAVAVRTVDFSSSSRIAYYFQPGGFGNVSNIYTILPDGTDEVQITNATEPNPYYYSPAWSSDGTMLAFDKEICLKHDQNGFCIRTIDENYYFLKIVVIDLTSAEPFPNNVLKIVESEYPLTGMTHGPSFSPDGDQIAAIVSLEIDYMFHEPYTSLGVFDLNSNSWSYIPPDLDEDAQKQDNRGSAPAWSHKGDKIAYYLNSIENFHDIFLINPDGSGQVPLTNDEWRNTQPAWSPDDEWILFVSDRDGGGFADIWIMDSTGSNMQKVRDCDPACWSPSFSPDGLRIAFEQDSNIYNKPRWKRAHSSYNVR